MDTQNKGICSVISFCTNDFRYLDACIKGVQPFSDQIIISVSDHFFDGSIENFSFLETIYEKYSHCLFVEFAYDPSHLYGTFINLSSEHADWGHHWHNSARLVAFYFLDPEMEYVFFCDVDEIVEGEKLKKWLSQFPYREYEAIRFAAYCYFREARFQSKTQADSSLLVKKSSLCSEFLLNPDERMGIFWRIRGEKKRMVRGEKKEPFIHHYSWVKTKEEMKKKTQCWGHSWERDWEGLIEQEFAASFKGTDFVRKYKYKTVEPFFDPLSVNSEPSSFPIKLEEHILRIKTFSNVCRVDAKEIFRKDLMRKICT